MVLQAIYTAVIMLAAIPTGIAADHFGRKKVLVIGAVLFAAAWAIFAQGHTYTAFLLAEIIIALATAMWFSSGTAFLYDTLCELKRKNDFKRLYGKAVSINYGVWGLSALAGGYLAGYGLRIPFWTTVVGTTGAIIFALSFTETKKQMDLKERHYTSHFKNAVKVAAKNAHVRLMIIYMGILTAVSFAAFMLYQPYLGSIGLPLVYFGAVYLTMDFLAASGSKSAHRIGQSLGENRTFIFIMFITILSLIGMATKLVIVGAIFPIVIFFVAGIAEPLSSDYLNRRIKSHHRATVLSFQTLVGELLCTGLTPLMGIITDRWSLQGAFGVGAGILSLNLIIFIWGLKKTQ